MEIKVKIKRYDPLQAESYFQEFSVNEPETASVSSILTKLNEREPLFDTEGRKAKKIDWECSCSQKMCGACAMIINGVPGLACAAFLKDFFKEEQKNPVLQLEPLSKFPVVRDLRVNRSQMYQDMKKMKIWLNNSAIVSEKESEAQYESAGCIMCGCCLEVCTNYSLENTFVGAAVMNGAYRVATQQKQGSNRKQFIKENVKNGQGHCSKSLSCEKVCPVNIPIGALTSKMNRLYIKGLFFK
ncbi:succinate dehydrogenase/fumarate reductase iron-sulfur subunit [Aminipila sp.]|uniref:succinate dehydrogenase/fumarate reductase iron-sulfur subunit n=1 Tax=Aminipila sp. TaxID=2060095 RepID=UPI0028A1E1AF|nr:2Fe-2S iron-sulfur cluster-binding protein [Aminipila sp.]